MGRELSCLGNQEANSHKELACYVPGIVLFTSLQRAQPLLASPSGWEGGGACLVLQHLTQAAACNWKSQHQPQDTSCYRPHLFVDKELRLGRLGNLFAQG